MSKKYLGIDCGASNLRLGIVDEKGNLQTSKKLPSPLRHEPEKLAQIVKDQVRGQAFDGIGIGVPGPLDFKKGLILPSSNLGNITPILIRYEFERLFDGKIYLDRDSNLALLGEAWKGGAKGLKNVVMLTLGTGVGGAIMIDGSLERGEEGQAGELGHMYLSIRESRPRSFGLRPQDDNSRLEIVRELSNLPRCGLGHEGCLEAMISSAKDLDELATYLGYGLSNIVDVLNPEKIIIGGGKVNLGDFLPKAIKVMKQKGMKPTVDKVKVSYAKLGEWSGVYGAVKYAYT